MYPSRNTHAKSYTNPTQRQGKDTAKRTAFLHKIRPLTSTVQDDHSTQSDKKQEHTVAQNSHGEQQPDKPSDDMEHKSTTADDVTSIEAGLVGQPVPSSGGGSGWQALALFNHGELVDENEEEQQQRRAEFAAQRQRHLLADSLQAHYDAILADVSAAAESDDDDEEQQEEPQPHQDNNNEENATASDPNATRRPERHHLAVAMDLFMHMEADDEELDETESESDSE